MSNMKTYKKKLTNSGGGSRVLAFFAFLFAAVGCAMEPLGSFIYSLAHNGKSLGNLFSASISEYIGNCQASITAVVVSLVMFICLLSSSKKMTIGSFAISMSIFAGVAVMVTPVYNVVTHLCDSKFIDEIGSNYVITCRLISYALPAVSGFFIVLSGLAVAGKITDDYIEVEVPSRKNLMLSDTNNVNIPVQPVINNQPAEYVVHNSAAPQQTETFTASPENTVSEEPKEETATQKIKEFFVGETEIPNENEHIDVEQSVQTSAEIPVEKAEETTAAEVPAEEQQPPHEEQVSESIESPAENICRKCGNVLKSNAKFCPMCGTKAE